MKPLATHATRWASTVLTVVVVAVAVFLWPAQLGGSTRLVVVSGPSMEPTYARGDLVLTRGGGTADVSDTVVFRVPEGGAAGTLVIHRVVAVGADGTLTTRGDNSETDDPWALTRSDVVGEPLATVPGGGQIVFFLQRGSVLAAVFGLLVAFALWPTRDDDDSVADEATTAAPPGPPAASDGTDGCGGWPGCVIDDALIAEAEIWLDEQLAAAAEIETLRDGGRQPTSAMAARRAAMPSSSSSAVTLSIGASRMTLP